VLIIVVLIIVVLMCCRAVYRSIFHYKSSVTSWLYGNTQFTCHSHVLYLQRLLVNSRTNQIADNRIADWSIRELVNSLTGQLADNRIADRLTRELVNSWSMHWTTRGLVKVPIFSIATLTLTNQWPELDLHCWQLIGKTNVYGTAHILIIYYSVFSCPFMWQTSFIY